MPYEYVWIADNAGNGKGRGRSGGPPPPWKEQSQSEKRPFTKCQNPSCAAKGKSWVFADTGKPPTNCEYCKAPFMHVGLGPAGAKSVPPKGRGKGARSREASLWSEANPLSDKLSAKSSRQTSTHSLAEHLSHLQVDEEDAEQDENNNRSSSDELDELFAEDPSPT